MCRVYSPATSALTQLTENNIVYSYSQTTSRRFRKCIVTVIHNKLLQINISVENLNLEI